MESENVVENVEELLNDIKITKEQIYENREEIRNIRNDFDELLLEDTAEFFTDKLIILDGDGKNWTEIYKMAEYYFHKEHYHRCIQILTEKQHHLTDLSYRHLAAKCYFECKKYPESLEMLEMPQGEEDTNQLTFNKDGGNLKEWKSSIELLKGYNYEATGEKEKANDCFLEALKLDPFCYEAFRMLIKFSMLTKDQEQQLEEWLLTENKDADADDGDDDVESEITEANDDDDNKNDDHEDKNGRAENWMKKLYHLEYCNMKQISNLKIEKLLDGTLEQSVRLIKAENYYNECQFNESYAILSEIHSNDILNPKCIFLMIGCLLELKNEIVLQNISHKLVETMPESPLSWYAVGCYYYMTSNMDAARKYFGKSTQIDSNYQASMLMFAHSFEMEALHDQALAVYLDLSKVMARAYLPLLYVGVEYSHLNNTKMAEHYLNRALELAPENLFVLHELAIVFYQTKNYEKAKKYFTTVYNMLAGKKLLMKYPERWEPLVNNMGHVHRKLGQYDEAIFYYKTALAMIPDNGSTLDALGLVHSLRGELQTASDYFQKALSLKRDDAFALTMHSLVFPQICDRE